MFQPHLSTHLRPTLRSTLELLDACGSGFLFKQLRQLDSATKPSCFLASSFEPGIDITLESKEEQVEEGCPHSTDLQCLLCIQKLSIDEGAWSLRESQSVVWYLLVRASLGNFPYTYTTNNTPWYSMSRLYNSIPFGDRSALRKKLGSCVRWTSMALDQPSGRIRPFR